MKPCKYCRSALGPGVRKCPKCGAWQPWAVRPATLLFLIVFLFVAFFCGVVYFRVTN